MNIIKRMFAAVTGQSVYGDYWDQIGIGQVNVVNEQSAMRQSAVYACVSLIARSMASMPIIMSEVDERGFTTPTRGDDVWKMLNATPNPWQTAFEFREMVSYHLGLRGVCYVRMFRNSLGQVKSLVPLHPDNVSVDFDTSGTKLIYTVTDQVKGTSLTLYQKDVLHFRGLHSDLLNPMSPLAYAATTISSDISLAKHQDASFGNNSVKPGGILSTDKKIDKNVAQNIERKFAEKHGGAGNAGKVIVVDNDLKFTPLRISNADAQFIESRRFTVEDICRVFGVPPELIHQTVNSNYAQAEQQHLSFLKFTLRPLAQRLENTFLMGLLPEGQRAQYEFSHDFWDLSRGDMQTVSEYITKFVQGGVFTPNEARAKLRLPRDEAEGADKLYIQQNMASVDNLNNMQSDTNTSTQSGAQDGGSNATGQ